MKDPHEIGYVYGRLTVIGIGVSTAKTTNRYLKCKCTCGKETTVRASRLKNGATKSCGCLVAECARQKAMKMVTHGLFGAGKERPRLYSSWESMRARCMCPTNKGWYLYGGRGITICDEWSDFTAFAKDMESTWAEGLSLDRIDTNGRYCKENCRWATPQQQADNRRKKGQGMRDFELCQKFVLALIGPRSIKVPV